MPSLRSRFLIRKPLKYWGAFFAVSGLVLGLLLGLLAITLDRLYPLELGRYQQRSFLVLDRDGALLRAFTTEDGFWRLQSQADDVPKQYLDLLIAYEDKRFHSHLGVDPLALIRAIGQWAQAGQIVSGASTLTMQTARLLEPRPRTFLSKGIEILRALQLEAHFSKEEILSLYLTLAPYGGNLEGIRAASFAYFGKPPQTITLAEAALLVVLPQSPTALRPDRHQEAALNARNKVLKRGYDIGLFSEQAYQEARSTPLPGTRFALPFHAPHFAEERYAQHKRQTAKGLTPTASAPSAASTMPAASQTRTSLEAFLQANLEQNLAGMLPELPPGNSLAALVVETDTRSVRALVGSADYFNHQRFGAIDMTRAIRSPGSTLKPFIYGLGFEAGFLHPQSLIWDAATLFETYVPGNFNLKHHGVVTAETALRHSLNIPAVAVLDRLGPVRFVKSLTDLGLTPKLAQPDRPPGLPIALGGLGFDLRQLVSLYSSLADQGRFLPLRYSPLETGTDSTAHIANTGQEAHRTLFSPAAAWSVTEILRTVPRPPGFSSAPNSTRPAIAYKTGTSYGYRDAWAVGYNRRYTVGVWVGRPDGSPNPGHHGFNTAAPILFRIFSQLPPTREKTPERRPDTVLIARNHELPPGLRWLHLPGFPNPEDQQHLPLAILFPPQDAKLALRQKDQSFNSMPLKARGGRPPLRWVINGVPLPMPARAPRQNQQKTHFWQPDGRGQVSVTVIDADGQSRSHRLWID